MNTVNNWKGGTILVKLGGIFLFFLTEGGIFLLDKEELIKTSYFAVAWI